MTASPFSPPRWKQWLTCILASRVRRSYFSLAPRGREVTKDIVVVAVFKHANELELVRFLLTNRDNDRKIAAVYVEMRDMMSVLI